MRTILGFVMALSVAAPVAAENFTKINSEDRFVSLVDGRDLTRFGITLNVTPGGDITGRAFGRAVRGDWNWRSGYFCRDLFWGERNIGPNCQTVAVKGNTLRFISDRGRGEFADLVLK